jgi:hypothetical protein
MSGDINMGNFKITSIANPASDGDGVNKKFLDDYYLNTTDFRLGKNLTARGDSGDSRALVKYNNNTLVINYAKDFTGGVRVDSDLSMNSNKITSLATPSFDTDAVNKTYVDSLIVNEIQKARISNYILDIPSKSNCENYTFSFAIENESWRHYERNQFFIQLTLCEDIKIPDFDFESPVVIGENLADNIHGRIKYFERYPHGIHIFISIFSTVKRWDNLKGYLSVNILEKPLKENKDVLKGNYFEEKYNTPSLDFFAKETKIVPKKVEDIKRTHRRQDTLYSFDNILLTKLST